MKKTTFITLMLIAISSCSFRNYVPDDAIRKYHSTQFIKFVATNWKKHKKYLVYDCSDEFIASLNTTYLNDLQSLTAADARAIFGTPSGAYDNNLFYYLKEDCDKSTRTKNCYMFYIILTPDGQKVFIVTKSEFIKL
ncbi:MAG: hypothetical protein KA974_04260 [Saprospiraceae bacterium]|nr:hypothetical protein [Saprospiraceae bacterium]MBP7680217.1 hypothetical protein [Saprospiraceae bacterium]